jgi:hypothetical protein
LVVPSRSSRIKGANLKVVFVSVCELLKIHKARITPDHPTDRWGVITALMDVMRCDIDKG